MTFFGLDTLTPNEWVETGAARSPPSPSNAGLTVLSSLTSARQLLQTDKDPLGLNDLLYMYLPTHPAPAFHRHFRKAQQETASLESAGSILLSSPHFHPRMFLRKVHSETTYHDLVRGHANLEMAVEQRNETLKNLVKQNFDRFVNAKNSIEVVYADMKARGLTSGDCGTRRSVDALAVAFQKAQQIYHPLLARTRTEETIRKKIAVIEKYKFLFALGSRIQRSLQLGEYQGAVYDYKKAKALMAEASGTKLKPMLARLWTGHIEQLLAKMRQELFRKLASPVFSFKVHSKLIGYLAGIDATPDPTTFYFDSRRSGLFAQIRLVFDQAQTDINSLPPDPFPEKTFTAILALVTSHAHSQITRLSFAPVRSWRIRGEAAKSLSDLLVAFLPGFCKFLLGVEKGVAGFSSDLQQLLQASFESLLSTASGENAAVAAVFGPRLLTTFLPVVDEAGSQKGTILQSFHALAVSLTAKMWQAAIADAQVMPRYEEWALAGEGFDFSTALLKSFEAYLVHLLHTTTALLRIYWDGLGGAAQAKANPAAGIDRWLCQCIVAFLDSMHALVQAPGANAQLLLKMADHAPTHLSLPMLGDCYRQLTIMSNVLHLKQVAIPRLTSVFNEASLGAPLSDHVASEISGHLEKVDRSVSQLFIASKQAPIVEAIHGGILDGSFDWETTHQPCTLRPYVSELLLDLVSIQTEISDVSTLLLRPIMSELVLTVFQEILLCFQSIRSLSFCGYLQARMDLDFLGHKLATVMTNETLEMVTAIHATLDQCSNLDGRSFDEEMVKSRLLEIEGATSLQFSCFQYT